MYEKSLPLNVTLREGKAQHKEVREDFIVLGRLTWTGPEFHGA